MPRFFGGWARFGDSNLMLVTFPRFENKVSYVMIIYKSALALSAVLISGSALSAVLDQHYEPPYPGTGHIFRTRAGQDREWLGQTFIAGMSGTLDRVDLPLARQQEYNSGLTFDVFSVVSDGSIQNPLDNNLGALLASVAIPAAAVPVGSNYGGTWPSESNAFALHIDLTGFGIPIVAGQTYALVVSATDVYPADICCNGMLWMGSNGHGLWWQDHGPDEYLPGRAFSLSGTSPAPADSQFIFYQHPEEDLGFKTYVSSVPEPSAPVTMMLGLVAIAGFAVRSRSVNQTAA